MNLLDGKKVRDEILNDVRKEIECLDRKLELVVVQIGEDPASCVYVKQKEKMVCSLGCNFRHINLSENISESRLKDVIEALNYDENVKYVRLEDSYINNLEITNNSGPIYASKLTGTNFKLTSKASTNDIVNSTYNSYTFDISNAAVLTLKQSICTGATEDEKIKVTASSANIAFTNVKGNIEINGEAN